ncbi:MAG: hypothetical protein EOM24_34250 [Chloroflexia bacterium]|nr:hypothetical protein [Chloroflexia bacterium]
MPGIVSASRVPLRALSAKRVSSGRAIGLMRDVVTLTTGRPVNKLVIVKRPPDNRKAMPSTK